MMTKEEVAEVVAYCDENKISYKQRLSELGISNWSFYSAKRKYAPKQEGDNAGDFLQLIPGGTFLPNPIKPARSKSWKQKDAERKEVSVCIELRTPHRNDDANQWESDQPRVAPDTRNENNREALQE